MLQTVDFILQVSKFFALSYECMCQWSILEVQQLSCPFSDNQQSAGQIFLGYLSDSG